MGNLWPYKNHHYRSKYPIVSLQECFRILQFKSGHPVYTAVAVRKTWVLHKPIKNRPTLAYKNIVRKCYEDMFFITNIHFNNPTSSPQT